MKFIHYIPKSLKLIAYTIFGNEVKVSPSGRLYEVADEYIISYNKGEFQL